MFDVCLGVDALSSSRGWRTNNAHNLTGNSGDFSEKSRKHKSPPKLCARSRDAITRLGYNWGPILSSPAFACLWPDLRTRVGSSVRKFIEESTREAQRFLAKSTSKSFATRRFWVGRRLLRHLSMGLTNSPSASWPTERFFSLLQL